MTASAPSVLLLATPGDILALDFRGETLEAQLGEPVFLSFSVENRSDKPVSDIEVVLDMPSGLAWSQSLEAVDSVRIQPGQVTLYMGVLTPYPRGTGRPRTCCGRRNPRSRPY